MCVQLFNEVPHLADEGFLASTLRALWPTEARPPEVESCLSEWIHSSRSQNPVIINLNLAFDQISLLPEWSATSKPCGLWTPVTRRLLRLQRKKYTQAELSSSHKQDKTAQSRKPRIDLPQLGPKPGERDGWFAQGDFLYLNLPLFSTSRCFDP